MAACLLLALSASTPFQAHEIWKGMLFGFPVLVLGTLFDFYLRRGYRVSYTDEAVYWRKVGFSRSEASQIVMPFQAVSRIVAEAGALGIKPFEAAILQSNQQDAADIILSRMYLHQDDLRDLLATVAAKSEALIDEEVSAFIG